MRARSRSRWLWLAPALSLLVVPVPAQDAAGMQMPKPAAELAKYEPLVGTWDGAGEMLAEPGGKPAKWTAEATAQWALGNFFVEERMRVLFGEGQPALVMHSYYGFDADTRTYNVLGASNKGSVDVVTLHWTDPNTLVGTSSGVAQGKPYTERWVTRLGKDSYDFRLDFALGDGPFYTKVSGKFTRSKTTAAAFTLDDARPMAPAATEHKRIESLIGTWKVKGTMIPAPGAPPMPITGTETTTPALGGSLLRSHTIGDPSPGMPGKYESFSYYCWDADHRAYDLIYVSNMGEAGKLEGRFTPDGALVWTCSQPYMGTPSAARTIQTFKDGGISITADRLLGTGASVRDFAAEYTRAK